MSRIYGIYRSVRGNARAGDVYDARIFCDGFEIPEQGLFQP